MTWTIKKSKTQVANKGRFKLFSRSRSGKSTFFVKGPGMPMARPVPGDTMEEAIENAARIILPYEKKLNIMKARQMGKGSRLYTIWDGLKKRTLQVNNKDYAKYGGRGIRMCRQWENSFMAFRKWSIKNGYRDDLTLDRQDNEVGYSPNNCRWLNMKEQSNNRTTNLMIQYKGKTQTLKQWTEELGLKYNTIYNRIKRLNWTPERAFKKR